MPKKYVQRIRNVRRTVIIIVSVILFLSIIFFVLGIKIRFFLTDELNLELEPLDSTYSVTNNEQVSARFTIKNNNFVQCKSTCSIRFTDLRDNQQIYSQDEDFEHNEKKSKEFSLMPSTKGSGQAMYLFEAECKNKRTALCLTGEKPRYRSSLVVINYNLSQPEKRIKDTLKPLIEDWITEIKNSSKIYEQNNILAQRIPVEVSEEQDISKENDILHSELYSIKQKSDSIISLWDSEEYLKLDKLFSESDLKKVREIKDRLTSSQKDIIEILKLRNKNIDLLGEIDKEIITVIGNYNEQINFENLQKLDDISQTITDLHDSYLVLKEKKKKSEKELNDNITQGILEINNHIGIYNKTISEGLRLLAEGEVQIAEKNGQTIIVSDKFSCDALNQLIIRIDNENNLSANASAENSSGSIEDTINISGQVPEQVLINNTDYIKFFNGNCRDSNINEINATSMINKLDNLVSIGSSFEKLKIDIPVVYGEIKTELDNNPPMCCVFDECKPCCADCGNKEETFPVLFIHGHTVNEANTPEFSMAAFTKIQRKLQEDGFINAGQLDLSIDPDKLVIDDWGRNNKAVTVRASYYYIPHFGFGSYSVSLQKSERIENYAIRLKEIIDVLKYRTGSDKVNIIAHSMGGLVAREYLHLFGPQDVKKLVTINSPHHGISSKIKKACSVLSSYKECDDMGAGSVFLSRLNLRPLPKIEIHAIQSTGCLMDNGKQGDGIVNEDSASLEGAKNHVIKGECTDAFNTNLHSNVLDIELYPETYGLIKEIISEPKTITGNVSSTI